MAVKVQDVVTMHPHGGGESPKIRAEYDRRQGQNGGSR
jgi:hypothetical protein